MTQFAKKISLLFGLLAMLVWLSGCQKPKVVATAEDGKLTVTDETGEHPKTHDVAPDAKITRDGQPAELEDLQPGDKVRVATKKEEGGKSVATEVKAESEKESEPPAYEQPDAGQDPAQPMPLGTEPAPMPKEGALPSGQGPGASASNQPKLEGEGTPPAQDRSEREDELADQPAESKDEAGARATFEGNIVSLEKDKLTVLVGDQEKSFRISEDTQIVFEGNEASAEDLKPGHFVTVDAEMREGEFTANSINARTER